MRKAAVYIIPILSFLLAAVSCSTTRVLQDGEYRLASNEIKVLNDKKFDVSKLTPYIKQKPNSYFIFGWNPFLNIYNWSNGKGKGWDKFVQKIGVPPVVYDPDLVESSIENIGNHLKYLGYYGSEVNSTVKVKKRRVKVLYDVRLGKRYPIKAIHYSLPDGELAEEFLKDTASVSVKVGDWLSEEALEAESIRSSKYLRNKGFYDFNKNYYFFEADTLTSPDSAILEMKINTYTRNETPKESIPLTRYKINSVSFSYPKSLKFNTKVLKDLNTIIPGTVYSETEINNTYSRLSALRLFNSVNIEMSPSDSSLVDCNISLSQSRLQGFKLNLEASTNSSILLGISPQLSYYHKNIFRHGEWLNLSFMGNFQFKPKQKVHSNEFGVSASLSFPRFLLLPYRVFKGPSIPRTDIKISYNYQNRPEYTRNILSTSYGYSGSLNGRLYYQFYPIQLNIVRLFDLDNAFYENIAKDPFMKNAYQNHFDLGLGLSLYYTTDSSVNPKNSFFYTRFQFDLAGNLLSAFKPLMKRDESGAGIIWKTPYSQYVRAELTIGKTWKFGRKNGQAVATRLVAGAGYAYGNSSALPFEKHFYAGGSNSLRGWVSRTVGPGLSQMDNTFIIPNQTGDMKLEANIEYRFKIFWKIAGAVFLDAGNIWTLNDDSSDPAYLSSAISAVNFGQSIAANWGVGIRLDLDFLLLRVDMGMKIHDPARVQKWVGPAQWFTRDGCAFHFGVGYPF